MAFKVHRKATKSYDFKPPDRMKPGTRLILRGENGGPLALTCEEWQACLQIGKEYGWRPQGVIMIDRRVQFAQRDYFPDMGSQWIRGSDVSNLTNALEQALQDGVPDSTRRKLVKRLIDFAGQRALMIGLA